MNITKNINKLPKSLVEVEITLPWVDVQAKWDETLQRLAADIELPGFRKGQVPVPMVESNLGKKLEDEVLRAVMPQALVEALQGSNIIPIDYPRYQMVSFVKGQPLAFKAVITERPGVKVGDYKAISVQKPPVKDIGDEDVNRLVEDLFKRWKVRQPSINQAPTGQGASGSLSFGTPKTNGSTQATTSDAPDDAFAKAVGANSLDDLQNKLKVDLENEAKYNNELDFEEAILQEVEKITEVDIPDVLVEDELNRMLVNLQRRVTDAGLLLDDYLKSQGRSVEAQKNEWRPQAVKNVKMELGLSEIARAENVQISDEQLQAEIDKIQDGRLKAQMEAQEPRMHLRHSLGQVATLNKLKKIIATINQ